MIGVWWPAAIAASSTGKAIALALFGIAAVVVVSAGFYVVGRGEDRDREDVLRQAEQDEAAREETPAEPPRPRSALKARRRRP